MNMIKIVHVDGDCIRFSNGDEITFDHAQDCCEYNYADFSHLDNEALTHEFQLPLQFEAVDCSGFRFGDGRRMFFVPCYSEQNGYYTTEIEIWYNGDIALKFDCEMDSSW